MASAVPFEEGKRGGALAPALALDENLKEGEVLGAGTLESVKEEGNRIGDGENDEGEGEGEEGADEGMGEAEWDGAAKMNMGEIWENEEKEGYINEPLDKHDEEEMGSAMSSVSIGMEVSGHGELESRQKEPRRSNSSGILRINRNEGVIVRVRYVEDGEEVEFGRHESSDQTESSDAEEEGDHREPEHEEEFGGEGEEDADEDDEDDEEKEKEEHGGEGEEDYLEAEEEIEYNDEGDDKELVMTATLLDAPMSEHEVMSDAKLKFLLEETRARRRVGTGDGGSRYWDAEGLYTVDGDYDAFYHPQLENARYEANRSILVNRMAQAAFEMKLPPSGLYLAVLLLDFYWDHHRAKRRSMDAVQLVVLAYTCLYISSNHSFKLGRTPDEFCQLAGGSVKGCMIIRQLEAFETLLPGQENVSSINSGSLWALMTYLDPEEHMSTFIKHLESSEYGHAYFTADVLKDANYVKSQATETNATTSAVKDAGKVLESRLLLVTTMNARNKRTAREAPMGTAENAPNKSAKLLSHRSKIAVL